MGLKDQYTIGSKQGENWGFWLLYYCKWTAKSPKQTNDSNRLDVFVGTVDIIYK